MMAPSHFESNKSTGPVTAAGKETVSKNALVHGLSGRKHAALPGEEGPYENHCRLLFEAMAPVGALEEALANDIAGDRWRLNRARAMENALFDKLALDSNAPDGATANAEAWVDASNGLRRIAGYAAQLQRAVERNTTRLEAMQAVRKAMPKPRKKPSSSRNWLRPKAKPTTPRPIFRPQPEGKPPPGSLFTQRPKSPASSTAPPACSRPNRAMVQPPARVRWFAPASFS
jgi:hypothetical protein